MDANCKICSGTGLVDTKQYATCSACRGSGQNPIDRHRHCLSCNGSGSSPEFARVPCRCSSARPWKAAFFAALSLLVIFILMPPKEPRPPQQPEPQAEAVTNNPLWHADPYKPGSSFRDCPDCPDMVIVPAGAFTMGSPDDERGRHAHEGPLRLVKFAKPFAVGRLEVTRDEFEAYVKASGHKIIDQCRTFENHKLEDRHGRSFLNPGFPQEGNHPAVCVSFYDARRYLAWLSEKTGKTYRFLTEAEWEYAARAGTTTPYSFGNSTDAFCDFLNGLDESAAMAGLLEKYAPVAPCNDGRVYTAPVGSYKPNIFGLHDMLGNAAEWVEDYYDDNYLDAPLDGTALETGNALHRVVRGGSWHFPPAMLRVANRAWIPAYDARFDIGFRVARTL